MPADPMTDTRKLCVHTITTKPLSIEQCMEFFPQHGVGGITVWRDALEGREVAATGKRLKDAGLDIVSLCRGGFFPATEAAKRQEAIDDNLKCIDEAAELGAPLIVLVVGAVPGMSLDEARKHVSDGIAACLDRARAANVKLAIEPLHPMYADSRSCVNTMKQANDMCEALADPLVGVAVDVYHLWWDPNLEAEIKRCGAMERLFAYHICDWKTPTEDLLLDRGLMGEGCIDLRTIRGWVEAAGFDGYNEVEIFSNKRWAGDQVEFLKDIRTAYLEHS